VETKKVRWPSSVIHDDSASTSHLRSRKKNLDQAPETTFSSRKRTIARGADLEAGAGVGGAARTTARKQRAGSDVDAQTEHLQTPSNNEVMLAKVTEAKELRRERATLAADRSKIAAEYEKLTGILAQSPRARLSRLAQSTLHEPDASMLSPKYDEEGNMQAPPSLPMEDKLQEGRQNLNELDGINGTCDHMHGRQQLSHALTEITSVVREREILDEKLARIQETSVEQTRRITVEQEAIELEPAVSSGSPVDHIKDSHALAHSLSVALCSNGCIDSIATHFCQECDQAICSLCAIVHARQAKSQHHVLSEISVLLHAQRDLHDKAARVRADALEHSRAREREIQELEAATARAAAAASESRAAAEKEKACRKEEEDEILLEKQKLEEALARVQAHSFRSVFSSTSPRTKESIMTTPISGVAAAAPSVASAPAICSPGGAVRDLLPAGSAQAGLSLSFQRALSHVCPILA